MRHGPDRCGVEHSQSSVSRSPTDRVFRRILIGHHTSGSSTPLAVRFAGRPKVPPIPEQTRQPVWLTVQGADFPWQMTGKVLQETYGLPDARDTGDGCGGCQADLDADSAVGLDSLERFFVCLVVPDEEAQVVWVALK